MKTFGFPAYMFKRSSHGHVFFSAMVGSKSGDEVMVTNEFEIRRLECAKTFDPRGYIEHICPIDQDEYKDVVSIFA